MSVEAQKALFLAAMALVVYFASQQPKKQGKPKVNTEAPDAIVLVPPGGIAGSLLIDEWAKENGYEVRRYDDGVSVADAEPWVTELYDATKGHRPAAAVSVDGKLTIIEVDDDLIDNIKKVTQ